MSAKKVREYLTPEEFQEEFVNWSRKTLERKIKDEGFPSVKDGNRTYIPVEKARLWFKKREVQG